MVPLTIPVSSCMSCHGRAVSPASRRLFSDSVPGKMTVTDFRGVFRKHTIGCYQILMKEMLPTSGWIIPSSWPLGSHRSFAAKCHRVNRKAVAQASVSSMYASEGKTVQGVKEREMHVPTKLTVTRGEDTER